MNVPSRENENDHAGDVSQLQLSVVASHRGPASMPIVPHSPCQATSQK